MSRQDAFYILLTSVGLVFSFPPFPVGFLALAALVPFFFYLRGKRLRDAFRGGYAVGLLWACGMIYWIGWATIIGLVGALIWMPISFALFSMFQSWLCRKWGEKSLIAAPVLWTGIEIVFSWGEMGFTWNSLAYTQTYTPILIQSASVFGMFGITFWVVLFNVMLYFIVARGWKWRYSRWVTLGLGLLLILPAGYGWRMLTRPAQSAAKIKISLVQGNIDPYRKWSPSFIDSNFVVYGRLTRQASAQKPDLIVWPETATPCYLRYRLNYLGEVKSMVDSMGIPLLTGAPDYEWAEGRKAKSYNAAFFIEPHSWKIDSYYKMQLVPFSERVPLVGKFPFLYDLARRTDLDIGGFTPGDSVAVFKFIKQPEAVEIPFAAIICYESIFPYLVRKFVRDGAQFLLVITNDGWFGNTSGPIQHAQYAVFRAVENRVWIARCANTGISEFIDPMGRIRARTRFNEEAVLTESLSAGGGNTFFTAHGDWFVNCVIGLNLLVLGVTLIVRRGRGGS
ncbi:MAG: apolipoprotein N-acyltransferase [bacterium]